MTQIRTLTRGSSRPNVTLIHRIKQCSTMKNYSNVSRFKRAGKTSLFSERKHVRMNEKVLKRYLFASDFDQTLTFNDSGYVLAEILGIPTEEFKRKATGMAKIN